MSELFWIVKLLSLIVETVPAEIPSIWVCILDVTPSKYPNSVVVTSLTSTLPEPLDCNALEAVKLDEVIVVAPPVIVACF